MDSLSLVSSNKTFGFSAGCAATLGRRLPVNKATRSRERKREVEVENWSAMVLLLACRLPACLPGP
jgi:hypothetical protein